VNFKSLSWPFFGHLFWFISAKYFKTFQLFLHKKKMKKNGKKNQSVCETKSACDSMSVLVASVLLKKRKKMREKLARKTAKIQFLKG